MTTAREDSGYGAGGKFKKRSFRRSMRTTPYDRPTMAPRNTPNINNNNNGWLSKLVDPAQRLIVSSAHRLFASVFRKRLTPPPPPPVPEANNEEKDMDQGQVTADRPDVQEAISGNDDLNNNSDGGGLTELEQILKQKTFSRSEIDRLTALLHSRTADIPVGDEQKSPEVNRSKPVVLHSGKEATLDAPVIENLIGSQHISTPVVLDEDIASPAELAKVFMGSRPSKVSPSMFSVRGQAFREESIMLNNQSLPSASPIMALVPRSSGHVGVVENGFVTPRTRGRSAIYSMARTPYSRVHSTSTFKGAGLATDSGAGPSSSSQSTWDKNRLTGSKPGILKRRSSVLDSDIGSVGPIRRTRQKSNLLSSKNLSLPSSGSPLSVRGSAVADAVRYPLSSQQMPLLSSEPRHSSTKLLTENGDNSVPSTSYTTVPTKSSEMASKILQQLDKLVSSREKPPTKLSLSMLRGPALKSMENVDSSIFLENVQDNNRLNGSFDTSLPDVRDSTSQKQDKVDGPTKFIPTSDKSITAMNGVDASGIIKASVPGTKTADTALTKSIAHPHPQKKQAFQMSAHEDYLELDDDDYSNGPASMPLADGRDKPNASLDNKTAAAEAITVEKSPAFSNVKPASPELNKISDKENSDGAAVTGKSPVFTFSTVPSPSITAHPAEVATLSTLSSNKAANESSTAPMFSFCEKATTTKESNAVSPIFSVSTVNVDKVPQFTSSSSSSVVSESSAFKFGAPLNTKPDSSTSFTSVAVGTSDSVTKVPESDKADNKVFFRTPETSLPSAASTSSSTDSVFSFSAPANSSSLNNGSLASYPSSTCSPSPPLFSSTGFNQNLFSSPTTSFATTDSGATSITTTSATMPSTDGPIFKFGSSAVPSTAGSPVLATSGVESTEAKKNDTTFGNSASTPFGGSSAFAVTGSGTSSTTSLANAGTGSSIFGGTLPAFTTGSGIFGGTTSTITSTGSGTFGGTPITSAGSSSFGGASTVANTGNSIFGFGAGTSTSATTSSQAQASIPFSVGSAQVSVNATGVATTTQSMPTQFGSSSSSTSFGLAGNPTFSSSSSPFGSSTSAVKPFGSTPSFGVSSTSSSGANSISSSSGNTTSVFGASWQAPKTPSLFGSTFNSTSPSTVFSFGASDSSAGSSSTTVFGSSTNGSLSSIFPFSSAAATSSQPALGDANSVFAFVSAPSNNNDQMSMEDSMAEDTVPSSMPAIPASTPLIPAFGQLPVSNPSSFVFVSAASSGANPFQFGSQQNMATPQSPSPFQASGSLDFNAGGSFSLGTGGGDKSQRKIVKLNRKPRKK